MDTAFLTVRSLRLDLIAAEVTSELGEAGIQSLLLKGASFATWLFDDGTPRPYVDCDILVSPRELSTAGEVLDRLGFVHFPQSGPGVDVHDRKHQSWLRGEDLLELHWRLPGIGLSPQEAWSVFVEGSVTLDVAGRDVPAMGLAARGLHLVLHAEHNPRGFARTDRDLRRALAVLTRAEWEETAALARRLRTEERLGLGLRLMPAGEAVADALGLPARASTVDSALRRTPAPPGARGLALAMAPYPDEKRRTRIVHHLFPPAMYMRNGSPLARRGRRGLRAAYAVRLVQRAWQLPRAALAVRRARRSLAPVR